MKLIYLMGIDGSGKTTLARALVRELNRRGHRARYFYAQHTPFLLLPLKRLARGAFLGEHSPRGDYQAYSAAKTAASRRHPAMAGLYARTWILDYTALTYLRLLPHGLGRPEYLVVDRYYPDVAVNISLALGLPEERLLRLAAHAGRFFPRPAQALFLDVQPEAAFARKEDISSIEYLHERRDKYLALQGELEVRRLDGELPPDRVLDQALRELDELCEPEREPELA